MTAIAARRKPSLIDDHIGDSGGLVLGYSAFSSAMAIGDVALSVAAALGAHLLYCGLFPAAYGFYSLDSSAGLGFAVGLSYVFLNKVAGLYTFSFLHDSSRHVVKTVLLKTILHGLMATLVLSAFLFVLRAGPDISAGTFLFFIPIQLLSLLIIRFTAMRTARAMLASGALVGPRVVIVGDLAELALLTPAALMAEFGFKEVGRVPVDAPRGSTYCDASVDHALDLSRHREADKLVVAMSWDDQPRLTAVRGMLRRSALPALLLPDSHVRRVTRECVDLPGRCAVRAITWQRPPKTAATLVAKRILDIILSITAIILLTPVMTLVAMAIKIDTPGPVIFRQRRHGFDRRPFSIFKFRSMIVSNDGADVIQAVRGDARFTRVGAFLRKTSIDELPQLVNVLLGHMSLVGPRPHAIAHDDAYMNLIDKYCFRQHVKPGITGWAQIHGARGRTQTISQMQARVEYDLWYIDHCSVWLDILIIARTFFTVIFQDAF